MNPNQARFESFPWEMEILELESLFDVLDDFLNDEQARNIYIERKRPKHISIGDGTDGDPNKVFPTGVQVLRRQIVVLLKTYLEQIIKDFSINVFIGKPEKMVGYLLGDEFQDGKEELEKILNDKNVIPLNKLPQIATARVMKGKLLKILNTIEKISNAKIKKHTKNILIKLNEVRTHIVHEASTEEISIEFLHESFEAVRDLIVSFREVCAKNNISDVEEFDETDYWE